MDMFGAQPELIYWDPAGMELLRNHVSDGEENENILKRLEALDPCTDYDGNVFAEGVKKFLKGYQKKTRETTEPTPISETAEPAVQDIEAGSLDSNKVEPKSGMARKSTVRFTGLAEQPESPPTEIQVPRRSWYPSPMSTNPPGAMPTPFSTVSEEMAPILPPPPSEKGK